MFQKNFMPYAGRTSRPDRPSQQVYCALCRGELYPGDGYYLLEGRRICEACLEPYAQHYFAHRHSRLTGLETEVP